LTGELTRQPQAKWNDPPLNRDWRDPDATVRRQVEAASGVIADRFAFCQRMPLATFLTASESLTQSGYRPVRFRPFAGQSSIEVAAVWTRDGRVWQIAHGLSREAISKRFEELENKGFAMEDLAGYRDGTLKFGAIWVAKSPLHEDVRILVGLSEQELAAKYDLLWRWHYFPITLQVANDDAGRPVISQVCRHGSPRYCSKKFGIPRSSLPEMTASGYPLIDASVNPDKTRDVGFSALGQMDLSFTSVAVCSVNEAAHRQECQAVMAQDYRPASISVGRDKSNHPTIVSVWQRPLVVDEMKIRAAKRVSNAAAALLKMDHAEPVWPVLKSSSDPTPRSFLIHRLARYDVSAAFLYRRLVEETDPSIREALILSLGEYQPDNWKPEPEHVQYLKMIYATAADPGVHSAAEWLLRRWNEDAWLVKSQAELAGQSQKRLEVIASALHGANAKPQWYVNGQQQTMVAIPGPLEFEMGLSIADTIYYAQRAIMTAYWTEHDRTHPCRIGRSIAVAAKPVTLEQYRRFDAAHHQTPGFAPSPDCPVVAITWYQAAAYCNWLSKQEGIPADEWCYEMGPNGQVAKRRANYLKKRGYRLPTEAELEVAMRAGTKTARSFGEAEELLPDYSWYLANSFSRTWPVGTKKPNDWGVFDAHGNVICFCDDAYGPFHWKEVKHSIDDVEEAELSIKPDVARIMHGGSFRAEPVSTDSGVRYATLPTESDNLGAGFRPARTLP
jgi:formylglycine-generating enzyme required for sulfatase activity